MALSQAAKKKIFVWVVAILFLGSIGGVGISGISGPQAQPQIPKERILTSLSGEQQAAILSSGGIIITVISPQDCGACVLAERELEGITNTYTPAVWMLKQSGANFSVGLIHATKTQEITQLPLNNTAVEDFICSLPLRLQQCLLRRI